MLLAEKCSDKGMEVAKYRHLVGLRKSVWEEFRAQAGISGR